MRDNRGQNQIHIYILLLRHHLLKSLKCTKTCQEFIFDFFCLLSHVFYVFWKIFHSQFPPLIVQLLKESSWSVIRGSFSARGTRLGTQDPRVPRADAGSSTCDSESTGSPKPNLLIYTAAVTRKAQLFPRNSVISSLHLSKAGFSDNVFNVDAPKYICSSIRNSRSFLGSTL